MQYYAQQIAIAVVLILGLLLAVYFGINVVDGNYQFILLFVGLALVLALFGIIKDKAWVLLPLAVVIPWKFNFLPGRFSFFEFAILAGAGFYFTSYLSIQKRMPRVGPVWIWLPFTVLFAVILYHWYVGGIGMSLFGGDTFGARRNLNFIFAIMAFTLILTLHKGDMKMVERLPLFYFLAALVGLVPYYVTTLFPSTAGVIFQIFGTFDSTALMLASTSVTEVVVENRQQGLATVATALQVFLISRYAITTWWRPERFWVLLLSGLCFYGAILSGFRSSVFVYLIVSVVAAFMTIRWKVLPFALLGMIVIGFFTAGHGHLFQLPKMVQRSLSFLPGDWDNVVIQSAKSSNAFRENITNVYLDEFAGKSPWIGTGFQFDPQQFLDQTMTVSESGEMQAYGFITRKDYHVGWISVYDTTGIIGCVAFGFLCLVLLLKAVTFIAREKRPKPVQIWACAYVIAEIIAYFTVFGALQNSIVSLAVFGGILFVAVDDLPQYYKKKQEQEQELESASLQPAGNLLSANQAIGKGI